MSVTVTARKGVFWRRSGKHGIRSQAEPPLHGSDRKAGLSHPCPNDSSFLKKRSRTRKRTFAYRFCVPKDKPIHRRYVFRRTAGFEPAINIIRGVEPHRTGPWRKPRSTRLPCASHPRHTLWQSLAHRCGFIHTRCWCLARLFYHIVGGGFTEKKLRTA